MKEGGQITPDMAARYFTLFVNRAAYTLQSKRPDSGAKYYYYRPKGQKRLGFETIARHLSGDITCGLYAINPRTQRCKWVAIDADYHLAFDHLLRIQIALKGDLIQSALERSRRGGHLWVFAAQPLLASECRLYIYNLATRLEIPIKMAGNTDGIEVFPRQDQVGSDEFGSAIRGPFGIHRGAGNKRFWFYGAQHTIDAQLSFLERLQKLTEEHLRSLIAGLTMPEAFRPRPVISLPPYDPLRKEFRILDHVPRGRRSGKDYRTKCPSCALLGGDKNNDNLAISVSDPRKYHCWAGCKKEEIRAAIGCPVKAPDFSRSSAPRPRAL
jgi:TOTE conflict system, Archaeo-Eukaryotic Primase domain